MGTGVRATEVFRYFDSFIERMYYDQATMTERWDLTYSSLSTVESLFNESNGIGLSNSLSEFFNAWNDLSQRPSDYGSRRSLMNYTETLASTLHQMDGDLSTMQLSTNEMINQEVGNANRIIQQIAEINRQLRINDDPGRNNANTLYDQRGLLVRQLNEIIDINYIDNGGGDINITTKAGQNLVDGEKYFELVFDGPEARKALLPGSNFDGMIYFEGDDNYEYTVQVTDSGTVTSGAGAARFKVSLDGGRTWLLDEDGQVRKFDARPAGSKVTVEGLTIWFGAEDNPLAPATGTLSAASMTIAGTTREVGDQFSIVPKKGLYWVKNTSVRENITPQVLTNGEDDTYRAVGGKLAALFNFRDQYLGAYRDKLDALAEGLAWEVNRVHSQGTGLEKLGICEGTYGVSWDDRALASDSTGLVYGSRLQSGSSMFYVYNVSTGLLVSGAALDFGAAAGLQNFNPNAHSLQSCAAAFQRSFGTFINVDIVNHKLRITAKDGYQFAFGTDTSGLLAALGLNTFFQGSKANDLAASDKVSQDLNNICAGHVNGAGEANTGDNTTALAISQLSSQKVTLTTVRDGSSSQTFLSYYDALVGNVGIDTSTAKFNFDFNKTLADDLDNRQQESSGVNLDEEMANLIKFQTAYTAAAKLVTTADQMLQTLLSLKT